MNSNSFLDPRHDIWIAIANEVEEFYFSSSKNVNWETLQHNIPSASQEKIQQIIYKIKNSETLNKGERIFLIMLRVLNEDTANNTKEILKQLQDNIIEIETIFVPWDIVLENQIRNHHEAETDPMKLATLYRTDATKRAIADAKAGIPPQQRDQFYRGIMKPPSETASRRNLFPGKVIYGLTGHLIVTDENSGAIQIQQVGEPYSSTLTGLWFDQEYFRSIPNHSYIFQKPGFDGSNVWDNYTFNEAADLSDKKS